MVIMSLAAPSTMLPPTIRVQSPILEVDEDFEEVEQGSHNYFKSHRADAENDLCAQLQNLSLSISMRRPKKAGACTSCGEELLELLGGCLTIYSCYCYTVIV